MRILFLEQFSELGGAQHALLDTVDAVQLAGWEPRVLVPGRGPLVEALESRRVPVGEIPCGPYASGHKSATDSLRFTLDLPRQVRLIAGSIAGANIDLVYVNGPRLLPAAALATKRRIPILFHAHNHLRGSALKAARWSLRRSAATVAGCGKSVLEALERKQHIVPNGVRDAGYRERVFDVPWRIGTVGRIAPEKGQMEFVKAAAVLTDEFPLARFVICGAPLFDSSSGYFDAVRQRARGLPVEFVEWQRDVGHILNELDLLVVPSHQEGMARIVLEAFSAGVPVVAFPAGGIPEAVMDGVTGFLARQFTAEALAGRIRDVMATNVDKVREIARNARQAWAQFYTPGAYQRRITELLETFAEEREAETPLQCR